MRSLRNIRTRIIAFSAVLLLFGTAFFGVAGFGAAAGVPGVPTEGGFAGVAGIGVAYAAESSPTPSISPQDITGTPAGEPDGSGPVEERVADSILGGGPNISAKSAIVMEVNSGAVLYSKDADASMQPLSLTKLMTALLTIENLPMTDTITYSKRSINNIGSAVTRIGLVEGEHMTVLDALYGMLVASADEPAYALGETIGKGKINNFITMMNQRMTALGGIRTEFLSATGTGGTKQTSCAYDLGLIACELWKHPLFFKIASAKWYEIPATNLKEKRMLAQTHAFIRKTKTYEYAIAGKTGGSTSSNAYSLCTFAEKDGMTVVAIVLGSAGNDRSYDDTVSILKYTFENYKVYPMRTIESSLNNDYTGLFDRCPMFDNGMGDLVSIDKNAAVVLPYGADPSSLTKSVTYELPSEYVHGENVIGHVVYRYKNHLVGNASILYNNPEYPMSQKEFEAVWPRFLIPPNLLPSQGGDGVLPDNSYLSSDITPQPSKAPADVTPANSSPDGDRDPSADPASDDSPGTQKEESKAGFFSVRTKAWILGIGVFLLTFVPCMLLIFVFLPRRARRKNRVTKRL